MDQDFAHQPLPEDKQPFLDFLGPHRAKVRFRSDPKQMARVRVEVPGIHKENEDVDVLPWARPNMSAWSNGWGNVEVPPLESWVTVIFENGDHAYPVYMGGWWAEQNLPAETPKFKRWETKIFGNGAHPDGVLKLESKAVATDAPDNFVIGSPLGKRLERDDRHGRQRLVLADQHDNGLFINTEHGTVALESWYGLLYDKPCLSGILLSSRGGRGGGFQIYNERGWRISANAEPETQALEIASPSGMVFRLDELNRVAELWTANGRRVVLSDDLQRMEIRTPENRGVIVDDAAKTICMHSPTTGMYMLLDDQNNRVDVRSTGDLRLCADGDVLIGAGGNVVIDGAQFVAQSKVITDISPSISEEFLKAKVMYREALPFFKRPYQEAEQKSG